MAHGENMIKAERTYRGLSKEQVYQAWTQTAELARWWGLGAEMDAKVGGKFSLPSLGEFRETRVFGEVTALQPNESLELTWKWQSEPDERPFSSVRVQFSDEADGAKVAIQHDVSKNVNGCVWGWSSALARLADALPFHFDYSKFEMDIVVNATPERTYSAWAVPAEITQWFVNKAARFDGQLNPIRDLDQPMQKGEIYEWTWLSCGEEAGRILEAIPGHLLAFDFGGTSHMGRELRTKVTIRFEPIGTGTRVHLTQDGIADSARAIKAVYQSCSVGWSVYLVNLKAHLEHGIDLREKNAQLTTPITILS